jgi:hypothetical protein
VIRHIAKFLGLPGGKRRLRQDPIAWVLLSVAAVFIASKATVLVALHLAAVKQVSR